MQIKKLYDEEINILANFDSDYIVKLYEEFETN